MSSPKPAEPSSSKADEKPSSPKPTEPGSSEAEKPKDAPPAAAAPVFTGAPTTETFLPATFWTDAPLPAGHNHRANRAAGAADAADDDDNSDADSAIGSDAASSTASISSSILAYRTVNGRTYHAERGGAGYWASNDETQSEAQDIIAHVCRLGLGGALYKSPIDTSRPLKVIDVGTGTGIWALDFADAHDNCEVIGTDVSPIQPTWVPPNLRYEIEDCTQTWTFPDNSFDFVHMRMLYGSIADWGALYDEAYRVLKPGGWLESHEASPNLVSDDDTVPPDSATAQWGKFYFEGGEMLGRTFKLIENNIQMKHFDRMGMVNKNIFDYKCPFGNWPKDPILNEIGRFGQEALQDAEGWLTYLANLVQGWTATEVSIFCAHLRAEVRDPKIHSYFRQRVVWGQKPMA